MSGLAEQKLLYEQVVAALRNPEQTLLVLVARAEAMSLDEAARAAGELAELGLINQHLVLNGIYENSGSDAVAQDFSRKSRRALRILPDIFDRVEKTHIPFRPHGVMGIDALKAVVHNESGLAWLDAPDELQAALPEAMAGMQEWDNLLADLEKPKRGVSAAA